MQDNMVETPFSITKQAENYMVLLVLAVVKLGILNLLGFCISCKHRMEG